MSAKKRVVATFASGVTSIVFFLPLSASAAEIISQENTTVVLHSTVQMEQDNAAKTNAKAKVRSGPGTNYKVVKTLPKGTKVYTNGWKTGVDGATWFKAAGGYIRADLLDYWCPFLPGFQPYGALCYD